MRDLKTLLKKLNISVKELASECGYTYFYTWSVLNGHAPVTSKFLVNVKIAVLAIMPIKQNEANESFIKLLDLLEKRM